MPGVIERVRRAILAELERAVRRAVSEDLAVEVILEVPREKEHGDFASPVALNLASEIKTNPRRLAQSIARAFDPSGTLVQRLEVAGPGFINFFLDPSWLHQAVRDAIGQGDDYGRSDHGGKTKVQVEFVSANPTGPMVVVQARSGAVGDTLATLMDWAGYDVAREFYINDAGNQVENLGRSIYARYRQALGLPGEIPDGGYPGQYLVEMGEELAREKGDSLLEVGEAGALSYLTQYVVDRMVKSHQESLRRYGVEFDVWFSEKSLHESGAVQATIDFLTQRGHTYVQDGAIWLRTVSFGDDKDRVLLKQDGQATYFAPDIAYHLNKFQRGFKKVINLWGPDHHGYVARMKAAVQALGYPEDSLEVLIVQVVRLIKSGDAVRMSKRAGEFFAMDDLLDEVGRDAARFFFLMRAPNAQLDFDLDLARLQSNENPVYYVQYAYARMSAIFRQMTEQGVNIPKEADLSLLQDESELDLMKRIADLPVEIAGAALAMEPHRITRYASDFATLFHAFYTRCRVLGDDPEITKARLQLTEAARITLRNVLCILGVSAPERM
jgi:arginyl-tRNA synthetase